MRRTPSAGNQMSDETDDSKRGNDHCVRCGYELSGLALDTPCPECTLPVRLSRSETGMKFADADYLRRIRFGALIATLGFLCLIGSETFGLITELTVSFGDVPVVLVFVATCTSLTGWFLMTSRDPAGNRDARFRFKTTLRILVFACFFLECGELACSLSPVARPHLIRIGFGPFPVADDPIATVLGAFWSLISLARYIITALFMRELALLLGNKELARFCKHLLWIIPLLWTVFILCFFIGPIIAMVLVLVAIARIGLTAHGILNTQRENENKVIL